jgi:hypothetical protein
MQQSEHLSMFSAIKFYRDFKEDPDIRITASKKYILYDSTHTESSRKDRSFSEW